MLIRVDGPRGSALSAPADLQALRSDKTGVGPGGAEGGAGRSEGVEKMVK